MGDTEVVSRELFPEGGEIALPKRRNETVSGGVKVIKEERFGDALVIEDYDSEAGNLKGKEIELQPRGKYQVTEEFAEPYDEEEESKKARDSHQFHTVQCNLPGTYCDHCGTLIWGITSGKQGLKCSAPSTPTLKQRLQRTQQHPRRLMSAIFTGRKSSSDVEMRKCTVCNYTSHFECEKKLTKRCRGYKSGVVEEEEEGEVVKNVDKDINFYDDLKNIGCHQFYPKLARKQYCNVCRQGVNLGNKGLRCAICRYVVHSSCAKDAERNCPIPYHVPDSRKEKIPKHHWIEGNMEAGGICIYCAKAVSGGSGMTNFQCYWCKGLIHNSCKEKHHQCDLGVHHNLKLPPHVFQRNPDESDPHKWLIDISMLPEEHCRKPVCVLINRMSGARQGASVIRQLSRLLNPMQIVDIAKGGPSFGIEFFRPLCKKEGGFIILACGGDGSVGWICEELDKVGIPLEERPAVVPLPIGTGNDLSRVLGWGPAYEDEDLSRILQDIEVAKEVLMDRWIIKTYMTEENLKAGKEHTEKEQEKENEKREKKIRRATRRKALKKKGNTLTRTWDKALHLSKETPLIQGLGKRKKKGEGEEKQKKKKRTPNKRKTGRSKSEKTRKGARRLPGDVVVVTKENRKGRKKEVMSDDEEERRSRRRLSQEQEEEVIVDIRNTPLPLVTNSTTTTNDTTMTTNTKEGGEGSNISLGSSLTRHKASLTKSMSMPAIGSVIKLAKEERKKKKQQEEAEEDEEAKELDEEEEDEEESKDHTDEENEQKARNDTKGKEKIKEDEEGQIEEEEEDSHPPAIPEGEKPIEEGDFAGMYHVADKIYNNYFSVGVDAKVALDFHIARESNPEQFKSRNYNKFKYFQYGAVSVLGGCRDLNRKISVVIDGKEAKIPNSVEGVVALNLTSYASGTNPWKNSKPAQEWSEQRIDDGLIEVVGVNGTLHLAQIRTGLSTGVQLGQGKRVVFILKEPLPVQADGEPWLQQSGMLEVTLHNKAKMLMRPQAPSILGQIMSPTSWFKKGKRKGSKDAGDAIPRNEFGIDEVEGEEGEATQQTPKGLKASKGRTPKKGGKEKEELPKEEEK